MNKVGVLLCAFLLAGLTVHVFTEPATTEPSCGPKDLPDAEKEDVQMYLSNNNQQEISTGEQDLSAFEKPSTRANTHSESGDQVVSDRDRPSTQAMKPSQEWTTTTASSDATCLPSTGEKVSSLPTVTSQATASSNAKDLELVTSTVTIRSTASSNTGEQELTTSPTVTTQAITSSHATEQEMTAFPTSAPQTTSFQNNEQEEFASTQAKFLTSTGGQAFSFSPASTSQGTMSSQDGEQESTDSQTPPPTIISTVNSLFNLHPFATMITFFVIISGIALFFLSIIIRYFVSRYKCPSFRSEGSYVIEDESNPNQLLTSSRRDDHSNSYQEDDNEELEMTCFRPLEVPPSGSDDPSSGQWKSYTL